MAFQSFESLGVWKRGCSLPVFVYQTLTESRDSGLRDQMQPNAVSIPSNIAEGYERSPKSYIAAKVGLTDQTKHIVDETAQLARMLHALARHTTEN